MFNLGHLPDKALDDVLKLDIDDKVEYFTILMKNCYPNVEPDSDESIELLESYMSSFYVEKLYRTNRFFSEKFTPVYTVTGLIRNITLDLYFTNDEVITH